MDGPVRTPATLSPRDLDTAMYRSVVEGILFALMVGVGESYFVANAIRIGASPFELGLVIALPLLVGSLGPAIALRVLRLTPFRRRIVVAAASGQACVLFLLSASNLLGCLTVPLLVAALCVYQLCSQAAGTVWASWYGDLVPLRLRASWFARRTRLVHLATFLGLVAGGVALHALEGATTPEAGGGPELGFVVVFLAAGVLRSASAAVLRLSPEPRFSGLSSTGQLGRFFVTRRGRNAIRLLVGGALFHVAVYVSSPYFAPYMLEDLRLGYLGYMTALASQVVIKFVTMPYWGRLVDRFGPRHAWSAAIVLAAAVPLPWLFVTGLGGVVAAQLMSGFAWGGYEVALFALLLQSSTSSNRPPVFAAQSFCNATGQTAGTMAGAAILAGGGYAWIFGVSLVGRMLVALVLPRIVHELKPAAIRRRPLLWRIIGFRPGGGVMHRPMLGAAEEDEPPVGTIGR